MSLVQGGTSSALLSVSNSVVNLAKKDKVDIERENGINYNLDEMKDFFMKHYNDTNTYSDKLQTLNLRQREKFLKQSASGYESAKSLTSMRALKKNDYDNLNINKQLKIGM